MIILDQIEKLINEHGSASILREHVALLKEQVSLLERENLSLRSKDALSSSQIVVLEAKNKNLTIENEELRTKIKEYEETPQGRQTKAENDFDVFNH